MFITSHEEWYEEYCKDRDSTWTLVTLSNDKTIYFKEENYRTWLKVKDFCYENSLEITGMKFQFRSNVADLDLESSDGVYLIRTIRGVMGGDSRNYYTLGLVSGESVKKDLWLLPELIIEESFEESVDNCFEEAIIFRDGKRKI